MSHHFHARVVYGRAVREEAARLLVGHGLHADAAAEARVAEVAGGADVAAEVFRRAVLGRVRRELGRCGDAGAAGVISSGLGWFDLPVPLAAKRPGQRQAGASDPIPTGRRAP